MFAVILLGLMTILSLIVNLKFTVGMYSDNVKINGRVVIVTGSNTGIGFETAMELARRGAKVIMACRDQLKGMAARNRIIQQTGNHNVHLRQLDLASFRSVRAFAHNILATETALHVLVNNAGTGKLDNSLTEDNLPIEAQVNHFGPFLLTKLLLPLLETSAPSRIVNVSSVLHNVGKIDFENFHKPTKNRFAHARVYSNTKLANMLFTRQLSKYLYFSGVTVNCLHPGAVSTDIFRHKPSFIRWLLKIMLKTPYQGAQTSVCLSVAPELEYVTGKYFAECTEARPSNAALDDQLAKDFWIFTETILSWANV